MIIVSEKWHYLPAKLYDSVNLGTHYVWYCKDGVVLTVQEYGHLDYYPNSTALSELYQYYK